jgi:hypothetical protein
VGVPGNDEAGGEPVLHTSLYVVPFTDGSQTLQMTRQLLDQSNYTQVPQLSCGMDIDLDDMTLVI